MKKITIFSITIILMLSLSGCGDGKTQTQPAKSVQVQEIKTKQDEEKNTNVLTLSMRTAEDLNPLTNCDASVDNVLRMVFEPLIALDETDKPKAAVAESWYYTEDGRDLTIKIKDGLEFHNGTNITAEDVAYSINVIKNSDENSVYKKCAENISSVSVVDRLTLTVRFSSAFSGNIYSMCFPVISKSYYNRATSASDPMGSGPYKFVSITPSKELVLEAADNSFTQKPKIPRIKIKMTTDADTDIYSLSQKITDCVLVDEENMGRYDFEKDTQKCEYTDDYYEFVGFNFESKICADKNFRKAIASCVPIDSIIDSIYLSNAVKASSPVNPSSFLYDKNVKQPDYDISMAKEYLSLSGWKDSDDDGILEKQNDDGTVQKLSVSILVNSENKQRKQVAIKIADELKTVGVDATVISKSFDEYEQTLSDGNFDMFVGGWKMSVVPYFGFMFGKEYIGSTNYISYSSDKMDSLLQAAYSSVNENDMKSAYSVLEKYCADDLPYISLLFRKSALYVNDRVGGDIKAEPFNSYINIDSWYFK
ncbi:MAG: ABC transporter substrate-binding protein [Clostridia bacterium]|nr:ABC transporter substrate-binding protein [Clostridia bacterium]